MFAASVHNVSAFVKCAFVFLHLFVILFVASLCVENCLSTDWVSVRYYDAEIFLTLVLRFVPECKWMLVICQWHASHASDMRVTCEWHASDMRVTLSPCGIGRCRKRWAPWPRCSAAWVRLCCCMATYGNCQVVTCRDMSSHVVTSDISISSFASSSLDAGQ